MRTLRVRPTRERAAAVAVIAVLAASAAACGSDSESTTAAPTQSVSEQAPSSTTPPEISNGADDSSAPSVPPPYIEGADWVQTDVGASLQIRPTRNGRSVSGDHAGDEAWAEVLALHPDADSPGMRAQFDCHWTFARLVEPNKPSWNLEPSRPVVDEQTMIAARCNPGAAEEE